MVTLHLETLLNACKHNMWSGHLDHRKHTTSSVNNQTLTKSSRCSEHTHSTNLRESVAYICGHAVFLPSQRLRWHNWSSPIHTHTHTGALTWPNTPLTSQLFSTVSVRLACAPPIRNSMEKHFQHLSLSLSHPLLSQSR